MKKSLFIVAFAALTLLACNKSDENQKHDAEGTHTHDDGSMHKDHKTDSTTKQEEFKVGGDSATKVKPDSTHKHDHSDPNHKH